MQKETEDHANVWIERSLRLEIKKIAIEEEITMRQLVSDILRNWIAERKRRYRNDTPKPPDANPPKKRPDGE